MSFTPFNAPLLNGLLGDREVAAFFSIDGDLDAIRRFEIALAEAQAQCGVIDEQAAAAISSALAGFAPDKTALATAVERDGLAVPELVRQMRDHIGEPHGACLHKGTTSQDAIDTSLMLRLAPLFELYADRLERIVIALDQIAKIHGGTSLMARTRSQHALPINLAQKISIWRDPLLRLARERPEAFPVQLGGPEGALNAMGDEPEEVAKLLADLLGLFASPVHWQTDRWPIMDAANWVMRLTNALGKIGMDVTIMVQNEVAEITLKGGGTSSAMPHKNNPVLAESLVTLARFATAQMNGLHQAALHENERSGISWALEWMILPGLMVAGGASLRNTSRMLEQLDFGDG